MFVFKLKAQYLYTYFYVSEDTMILWKKDKSQTCKMPEILPEQDFSIPDFTRKCVNYDNFKIATKQRNLNRTG